MKESKTIKLEVTNMLLKERIRQMNKKIEELYKCEDDLRNILAKINKHIKDRAELQKGKK